MKTCPRCEGPASEDSLRQFGGVCEKCLLDFAAERDAPSFPDLEIRKTLGEGGMGVVYEAVQKPLGRTVALKVLSPELASDPAFVERFTREAKALASLSHPNIVGIHDFGVHDGVPYLVMEHVQGASLRKLLASGKLTPARALDVIPQICDALAYAHSKGVVHRDIKPENVLLTADGKVKIADFGLAKLAEAGQTRITRTNMQMGTPHYMAPEQVENPYAVDHRADIYSLGVIFYEMLTGELPIGRFKAPSEKSGSDARLDPVVLKSLEKEPADRWQSASEVKERVSRLEELPASTPLRRPSLAWSLWLLAAAAICGMLAATASPSHFTGLYLGKDQERFLWFTTAVLVLFAGVQALRHAYPLRLAPAPPSRWKAAIRADAAAAADPGDAANAWKILGTFVILIALSIALDRPGTSFLKIPLAISAMAVLLAANVLAILCLIRRRGRSSAWGIPAVTLVLLLGLFPMRGGSPAVVASPARSGPSDFALAPQGVMTINADRLLHAVWPDLTDDPDVEVFEAAAAMAAARFEAKRPHLLRARYATFGFGKARMFAVEFETREARNREDWGGPSGWSHRIECPRLLIWITADDSRAGVELRQHLLKRLEEKL